MSVKASGVCTDNGDMLCLTGCHAAAAEDTLAVISYQMVRRIVILMNGVFSLKIVLVINAELLAELLKLAGSAAHAGETFFVMG